MTRLELLKEFYDQISHNLFCYSADSLITKPKKGYEKEWLCELDKSIIIEEMMDEEFKKEKKNSLKKIKIEHKNNEVIEQVE